MKVLNAVKCSDIDSAREFLRRGAYVNRRYAGGITLLHHAAWNQCAPMIRLLLGQGANPLVIDDAGRRTFGFSTSQTCSQLIDAARLTWTIKTIYICGPMTGLPDFNRPAIRETAKQIEADGNIAESPADYPDQDSHGAYVGYSINRMLTRCTEVWCLPGWERSRGCLAEVWAAHVEGLRIADRGCEIHRIANRCVTALELLNDPKKMAAHDKMAAEMKNHPTN